MALPQLHISRPTVHLPDTKLSNEDLIGLIKDNYKNGAEDWPALELAVRYVFDRCNSGYRYIETDHSVRVGDFGARAAQQCLEENGVAPDEVDLVINGSVAREYFEPATSMEIAAKIGVRNVHAFDVTSACAGQLEALHIASAYFSMYEDLRTALVVSAELTRGFLNYDIQSLDELQTKAAGLTIGNAASAWLVRRAPFEGGCLKPLAISNRSLPEHWHLCSAPIDGTFTSLSQELFRLNVHVPPVLREVIESVGWDVTDVDHFVFHQPSDHMVEKVLSNLEVDPDRGLKTHSLYGNTVSTTVSLTLDELLRQKAVEPGSKMVLSTAAAGFSIVTIAGEWVS